MDRAEHLQWCKDRAMEYVRGGDINGAFASMASDIMKHPDTQHHESTNTLGMAQLIGGLISTPIQMEQWIQGYN